MPRGGAINGQITGHDSEDGWFGVAGEFILNDLMRRAGPARSILNVDR